MSAPVNVDSKGYGRIYKAVMRNRYLPLLAKAIYAYFCVHAGNGYQAFPKRDKIVRDLRINKDTYTKHLNFLIAEGYVVKERTTTSNLYTIMRTVPGYERPAEIGDDMTDMLVMESVSAQGFGTVPKIMMLDSRLTAQAKAIYAYFASFAGAGTTAFPRRSTIMRDLGLSQVTYYAHYNLLLTCGYLTVEQRKSGGKYTVSLYRLSDCIEAPDTPSTPSPKGNSKAMSEKLVHGENGTDIGNIEDKGDVDAPMSEKLSHGELLKTPAPMSEILSSEKPLSEKMVHGNFGQAYINNSSITNNISEKEQEYYHQGIAPGDKKTVPLLSLAQMKKVMRYDDLRSEALAWGNLKETLGHFAVPEDKALYMRKTTEILDEIAKQMLDMLKTGQVPENMAAIFESEAFAVFFDNVLTYWDEIRSAKGYVKASLKNLLRPLERNR